MSKYSNGKSDSCIFLQGIMLVSEITSQLSFKNIEKWLKDIDTVYVLCKVYVTCPKAQLYYYVYIKHATAALVAM